VRSVLVCAADVVTRFAFTGFSVLKALTPPSAVLSIKRETDASVTVPWSFCWPSATARKHKLDRLARCPRGISNDANHITGPLRDGAALSWQSKRPWDGRLPPDDTQAFCAHGTGTIFNDSMELAAIEAAR
jgi:3-oxoacyl-[acyl-carrier-protein] synthase II